MLKSLIETDPDIFTLRFFNFNPQYSIKVDYISVTQLLYVNQRLCILQLMPLYAENRGNAILEKLLDA